MRTLLRPFGSGLVLLVVCSSVVLVAPQYSISDTAVLDSVREEDRLGARSDEYSRLFDKAISALVDGDSAKFRVLLSTTTVTQETRGPGAIDAIIHDRFIPFFADFVELTDSITTIPTYDAVGNTGLAVARSFKTTGGATKSFVIYIISEKERMVVGNLLLNTTEKQILESKKQRGGK